MEGQVGFEPTTYALQERRSGQLSYNPIMVGDERNRTSIKGLEDPCSYPLNYERVCIYFRRAALLSS